MNVQYVAAAKGQRLEAVETPIPSPASPKDVVIRLEAIAINPADYKMIDTGARVTSWPIVVGMDGAGTVAAVGEAVSRFKVGDHVLALCRSGSVEQGGGSYQHFPTVDESRAAKIPASWNWEEAASLPVCYHTAMVGLGSGLKLPLPFLQDGPTSGSTFSTILVPGGSSALGACAIQLLRIAVPDARIITTSSPKHHDHLTKDLGAHVAIDRSLDSLIEDIKEQTDGSKGVDAILDLVGAGASSPNIFDAFNPDGPKRYAQVSTGNPEIVAPPGIDSFQFRSRNYMELQGGQNIMGSLQTLLEEGKYKLPLPIRRVGHGLEGLEKGLELMRKGVSGEKLVVSLN